MDAPAVLKVSPSNATLSALEASHSFLHQDDFGVCGVCLQVYCHQEDGVQVAGGFLGRDEASV